MLKRIQIPPGISRESTQLAATGRWYDANNMRFRGGVPETIGGWGQDGMYTLEGIGRRSFSSRDYSGNNYQFVGTSWKYYVIVGTSATDITPIRATSTGGSTLSSPFTTVSGSTLLGVAHTAHGVAVNDWVVFSSLGTAPGSWTVNEGNLTSAIITQVQGFQVYRVVDDDNYEVYILNASTGLPVTAAVTNSAGQGGAVGYYYHVVSGPSSVVEGQGWGAGLFGGSGTPTAYELDDNPITTIDTTSTVDVEIDGTEPSSPAALAVDDQLYLQGLGGTSVGGINLELLNDQWWTVTSVASLASDVVRIQIDQTATSVASGGGTGDAQTYYRGYNTGATVPVDPSVDGATRGWGDASALSVEIGDMRRVYIDNYGEDVLFANSGGPVYYWDTSANAPSGSPVGGESGVAEKLSSFNGSSNTPFVVDSFLVSKKDGHCVAFGCNDVGVEDGTQNSLLVRWSDQNNPFDWTPTPTNTSGGQVLRVGSRIAGGVSTKDEVIVFTDAAVYSMRFGGPPDVFSFTLATEGVEIVSRGAAVNAANSVFFMGNEGFYVYSGSVSPLPSTVSKYVFDDFNSDQKEKCFAAVNSAFSEVMWFYPTATSFEPDRYVSFNYEEETWGIGSFDMSVLSVGEGGSTSYSRTSWRDAVVFPNPMSTYIYDYDPTTSDTSGSEYPVTQKTAVMIQESGTTARGDNMEAYIESGEYDISDGERFSLYTRMIPDLQIFNGSGATSKPRITLEMNGRDFPGDASSQLTTTLVKFDKVESGGINTFPTYTPVGNSTAVRGRGRSLSLKLSSSASGFGWRIGDIRIDLQPDGRR